MRKLKLDLDLLAVESFDTLLPGDAGRGTVEAFSFQCLSFNCLPTHGPTCAASCASCEFTCETCRSCDATCADSCNCTAYCSGYTCGGSCSGPTCDTCATNCGQLSCIEVCP